MTGRILYIAGTLPALSETFVYRELFALREAGVDVRSASVHKPGRNLGDPALDTLACETFTVYGRGMVAMLAGAIKEMATHPVRSLGTLCRAKLDAILGRDMPLSRRPKIIMQAIGALHLARRARGEGITHIHAHMAHVPTTMAMYAARQLGIPFSFTGHANDLFPQRALLKEKLRRAAFTSCISHWHRRFYENESGVSEAKLPIVRCGVDVREERPMRGPARAIEIVAVGRLIPKKGFDVLIDAIAKVRGSIAAQGTIIGGGPEETRLREQVTRLGVGDRVELLGARPNAEALRIVDRADLFVLPCRVDESGDRDGIPVALMEAMARGVCVISGDLPAIRELILDGKTGVMVPPGDVAALAAALDRVGRDAGLRSRLGEAGRGWVKEEFSTEVNTQRLLAALGIQSSSVGRDGARG